MPGCLRDLAATRPLLPPHSRVLHCMSGRNLMRLSFVRCSQPPVFAGISLSWTVAFAATVAQRAGGFRTIDGGAFRAKYLKPEPALAIHAGTRARDAR